MARHNCARYIHFPAPEGKKERELSSFVARKIDVDTAINERKKEKKGGSLRSLLSPSLPEKSRNAQESEGK